MNLKARLATATLASAALAGVTTVATTVPAQAGTWGYSVSVRGESACKGQLTSAIRAKVNLGYTVDLKQPCYHSGNGIYSAYFTYSS